MEQGLIASKRNTGLWPVRPAGILPAVLRTGWHRSKTPLGAQTWKSVFLHNAGSAKRRPTNDYCETLSVFFL